jgi:uncharacterized membrane protein YdjX (TVP38/TMEM64 family)
MVALFLALRGKVEGIRAHPDAFRSWILGKGFLGILAFAGIQALQVIVFVIPGELVQIAGGYLYGLFPGTAISALGILAGSLVNFAVGRILGREFVEAVFGPEKVVRLEEATASGRATAAFFLLFAIPGIPKDALSYFAGMSSMSLPVFLLVSGLGRFPGILGSSYMGAAAFGSDYAIALGVLIAASALFFIGLFFRERILGFIAKRFSRR